MEIYNPPRSYYIYCTYRKFSIIPDQSFGKRNKRIPKAFFRNREDPLHTTRPSDMIATLSPRTSASSM